MIIHEITFDRRFANLVLEGIKGQTRRPMVGNERWCPLGKAGDVMLWRYSQGKNKPRREIKLMITETRREALGSISDMDLAREGGFTREEFLKIWDKTYPSKYNSEKNPDVWVVSFRRVRLTNLG
jgi:hypothetical protein